LIKKKYIIFVYCKNPVYDDQEEADHKFTATGKRGLIGILKTIADNYDFEHISIFENKEVQEDE
jgi:hypothetical protein